MFTNTPCANRLSKPQLFATVFLLTLLCLSGHSALVQANNPNKLLSAAPAFLKNYLSDPVSSGAGTFRWFGLKIYDAHLWIPAQSVFNQQTSPNLASLFAQPFALRLTYARSLKGSRIAESSAEELERMQLGNAVQRALWLQQMTALFPDVAENDAITGLYLPGVGAKFYLNHQPLGTIEDDAFARAFFAIWLDPRTRAPDLRTALLNQANRGN